MMKTIKNSFVLHVIVLFLLISCNPIVEMSELMPVFSTGTISNVTNTTATYEGSIIYKGSDAIVARGICWSISPEPNIKNDTTVNGMGIGSFSGSIINLTTGITYYVRAYATTANGTWYGNVLQITPETDNSTPNSVLNSDLTYGTVTDIEGNIYHTITIGTQTWMAENLYVTKYRNGDAIPNEKDNSKWNALKTGAYSNYNNNVEANSIKKFGRLYNHYAVADKRNLAPTGWHVASDTEWSTLIDYVNNNLGSSNTIAQALTTKTDWTESSVDGAVGCLDLTTYTYVNNSSGFSGLPSGIRHNSGWFNAVGSYCCWWTSVAKDNSSVYFRSLSNYSTYTGRNVYDKNFGLSVRCVKD